MSHSRTAFAIVFAAAFALVYVLSIEKNYALFTYHPALDEWGWGVEKAKEGPAMYWYGWLATSVIAATVAGIVAAVMPASLTRRLSPSFAWAVPLAVILFFSYLLRNFFLR